MVTNTDVIWYDIETAPRDGSWILLGYTQQGDEMPAGLFVGIGFLPKDGNKIWVMNAHDNEKALPSHWSPLPAAPAESAPRAAHDDLQNGGPMHAAFCPGTGGEDFA